MDVFCITKTGRGHTFIHVVQSCIVHVTFHGLMTLKAKDNNSVVFGCGEWKDTTILKGILIQGMFTKSIALRCAVCEVSAD